MLLTIEEIRLILEKLGNTYSGIGYSPDPEVGRLQAKLSIMLEAKVRVAASESKRSLTHAI